jgi:hypothetical protein
MVQEVESDSELPAIRRQIMKIHGMSRTSNGEFLYAVSFAKAKFFRYMTHSEMVEKYPTYLIGFYERSLRIDSGVAQVVDPSPRVSDAAEEGSAESTAARSPEEFRYMKSPCADG